MADYSVGQNIGSLARAVERLGTNVIKAAKIQAFATLVAAGYSPKDANDEVRMEF